MGQSNRPVGRPSVIRDVISIRGGRESGLPPNHKTPRQPLRFASRLRARRGAIQFKGKAMIASISGDCHPPPRPRTVSAPETRGSECSRSDDSTDHHRCEDTSTLRQTGLSHPHPGEDANAQSTPPGMPMPSINVLTLLQAEAHCLAIIPRWSQIPTLEASPVRGYQRSSRPRGGAQARALRDLRPS